MYEIGKALSVASLFEIDDVIDPADTRRWLTAVLDAAGDPAATAGQEAPQHRHVVTNARAPDLSVSRTKSSRRTLAAALGHEQTPLGQSWPNIISHCSLERGRKT